ncbi:MAG: hypothetical protein AMXMBFR48_29050 [Ignavibacteriales bacterium]
MMHKLIVKTITPLHIGGNEQLALNLDYIVSNQHVAILNRDELVKYLAKNKVFNFNKNYSYQDVGNIVKSHAEKLPDTAISRKLSMSDGFKEYLGQHRIEGKMHIGEFINDGRNYYLPASSVKGAMLTGLGLKELGINSESPRLKDRFIMTDSDPIPARFFVILRTVEGRPPINIVCIKQNVEIELLIKRTGLLDIDSTITSCSEYSKEQLMRALEYLRVSKSSKSPFKIGGIENFEEALSSIREYPIKTGEFLMNIGFGGGGWFKVTKGINPTDKGKSPETSFEFDISGNMTHIGWCVCRFEEVN